MNRKNYLFLFFIFVSISSLIYPQYNPMLLPPGSRVNKIDLVVKDVSRKRDIPLRIYLPANVKNAPVILFSHGLGGSRGGSSFLGEHWSSRGYAAVFLQHAGSDENVWKNAPLLKRFRALEKAANLENFLLRVKDVSSVIDQLEIWNKTKGNVLEGMLDMTRIGMSGHSFGAITAQAVSGQAAGAANFYYTDPRIKAALILSPNAPLNKTSPEEAFKNVKIPWLLMTGTKDISPIGNINMESRLKVFPALPPGNKYELILYNAAHSVFTDRTANLNPNHHKVILALSTAFWDTYLKNDSYAREWLEGGAPFLLLESGDKWKKK